MKRSAVVLIALTTLVNAAQAEALRIGGTGGALALFRHASEPFKSATGIQIEVLDSLGSLGAIRALGANALDVAVTAMPLARDGNQPGFVEVPFARTALVFVTSHPAPDRLTSRDLVSIFGAANAKWSDGKRINLILRPRTDADTQLIGRMFAGMAEAIEVARKRPDLPIAATDQDSAALAERLPGSLVQAGLGQIIAEKRALRAVVIDGVEPSLENLESKAYPYQKLFYLVYPTVRPAPAERLLVFLRSAEGRKLLRETGNLPAE